MRIGTWNLAGKWSPEHLALLEREECDVWLLTEVHVDAEIPGMQAHRTAEPMGPGKTWAAVIGGVAPEGLPDPHRATAFAHIDGIPVLSSVLPWRSCGAAWRGSNLAEKQTSTLSDLVRVIDAASVWGGDWNQALEGRDYVGTRNGRDEVLKLTEAKQLSVPTRSLSSATPGQRSIDHIAVPTGWDVNGAYRVAAETDGRRLSDHDAYIVCVQR